MDCRWCGQFRLRHKSCFIAVAKSYMEWRLNSDAIKCLPLTSSDLLTCQRRRNSEVTYMDNKIQFLLQVRGNHFSPDREIVVTNFRCDGELVNDQTQPSKWIGGNQIYAWRLHGSKIQNFLYAWLLNSHSVPCWPQLYSDPVMYRQTEFCVQYELFSLSKKKLNNIVAYIRLCLSTPSPLHFGSQPTNRTVHLINLKRIFSLSYSGAAEPGWYPMLVWPCPLQCVTKHTARTCIVRSSFGVTKIWRKDEITSPQRRRTKVISWERSSITTGVSRLGDRGNETQFNFDTPLVCAFLDMSELLTGSRIYFLLTNTMAYQRVFISCVHRFFVLFFIYSHTGGPPTIPCLSMWDLWCTMWH